jgi:lipopolysaccharide export LptBFGC system permease protein LptF
MSDPRRGARPIFLTAFGIHTRYMLAAYLRHTLMVLAALMTIALTIDLFPQVALLSADPAQGGVLLVWHIIRLAALRLPDLMPPFLPFATFLGVVWSESAFTESRERMLVWNSGRSPLLCLMPALLAGLVMGIALVAVDAWLRPAAIHVQMREVLGREGIRLDRGKSGGNHWIALPDGLLKAEIAYGPPLRLRNVTIYKLDSAGHLAEVNTAALATPQPDNRWLLRQGHYWRADFENRGDVLSTGPANEESEVPFDTRTIDMDLNVLWLSNLGLSPQYLRLPELRELAGGHIMARDQSGYRTRLQAIYSEGFFAWAMALMGAALSMLYFPYRTQWQALVGVLLAGYVAHFASKALYLMGEFGYIHPIVATWTSPLLVALATGWVLHVIQKRRGLMLRETPQFTDDATSEPGVRG